MGVEEKDFFMRQVKELAKNFGEMLSKDTLKELIQLEDKDGYVLTDDELDNLLKEVTEEKKKENKTNEHPL